MWLRLLLVYGIFCEVLTIELLASMVSSKDIELEKFCVKASYPAGNDQKLVAVCDVPYLIRCAKHAAYGLAYNNDELSLSAIDDTRSLFCISVDEANLPCCTISRYSGETVLKSSTKELCKLIIESQAGRQFTIKILLCSTPNDTRPQYLMYNSSQKKVYFSKLKEDQVETNTDSALWIMYPAYDLKKSLDTRNIDSEYQLLKLRNCDPIARKLLSVHQCLAIYRLHVVDLDEELRLAQGGAEFYWGVLSSMLYNSGVILVAGKNCCLKVRNFRDCEIVDLTTDRVIYSEKSIISNKSNEKIFKNDDAEEGTCFIVNAGGVYLIKPTKDLVIKFGTLMISLQESEEKKKNTASVMYLSKILSGGEITLEAGNFVVKIDLDRNKVQFECLGKMSVMDLTNVAYAVQSAGQQMISKAFVPVDRMATSIENASENISSAMVVASNNMSGSIEYGLSSLSDTIGYVSKKFENTAKLLSFQTNATVRTASADMKTNVALVSKTIEMASLNIREALEQVSKTLEMGVTGSTREISQAICSATSNFTNALTFSTQEVAGSVETASSNFEQGMHQIKAALEAIKKTSHTVNFRLAGIDVSLTDIKGIATCLQTMQAGLKQMRLLTTN